MKLKNKTEMLNFLIKSIGNELTLTFNNYTLERVEGKQFPVEKLVRTEIHHSITLSEVTKHFAKFKNGSTLIFPSACVFQYEENKIIWRRNGNETIIEW